MFINIFFQCQYTKYYYCFFRIKNQILKRLINYNMCLVFFFILGNSFKSWAVIWSVIEFLHLTKSKFMCNACIIYIWYYEKFWLYWCSIWEGRERGQFQLWIGAYLFVIHLWLWQIIKTKITSHSGVDHSGCKCLFS